MRCQFPDYNPHVSYIRSEMEAMIRQQQRLLSLFAFTSGQPRCALGVDFEEYDPLDSTVPVYLLAETDLEALALVEGRRLLKAYRASRVGKNIIVTYVTPAGRGWFTMRFDLGEKGVDWEAFPPSTDAG